MGASGARTSAGSVSTDQPPASLNVWLERAACWRFASILFGSPTAEALADLRSIVPTVPEPCRAAAQHLSTVDLELWGYEYHRVLGPGGLPASESSYDRAALAGRGPALAEIAGFYRAFSYRLDASGQGVPDDISVELGFLAYLAFKAAYAIHEQLGDALDVTSQAYAEFLRLHVSFWMPAFLEPLASGDSDFYRDAATWLNLVRDHLGDQP